MLDLLVEDVAKIPVLNKVATEAHMVVSFLKSHSLLYEEFLTAKEQLRIRSDLHLFPTTRFAYLHFMLSSLQKVMSPVRVVVESAIFKVCFDEVKKKGGEDGERAVAKFSEFRRLVEDASFKRSLSAAAAVLQPISMALHYLEGDSIPLSHVYPVYQGIYDFIQSIKEHQSLVENLLDDEQCAQMIKLVEERWQGTTRKKGLKADVHLLAFVLDPYAQAAVTSPKEPMTPLFNSSTLDAARSAMRKHIKEANLRGSISQQLQLWVAARPSLPLQPLEREVSQQAVQQGANAFSSLYYAAMQMIWDKCEAREEKIASEEIKRPISSGGIGFDVSETIARLKLAAKPTTFWLSMMAESPHGATSGQLSAHKSFCHLGVNISSIVGHTCGVERAGKAYKMVLTAQRKAMRSDTLKKAVYVLNNYGLLRKGAELGDELGDFAGSLLTGEDEAAEIQAKRLHALRRGRLLQDEELQAHSSDDDEESDEDADDDQRMRRGRAQEEVKWSLPDGLAVMRKPEQLDDSLVNKLIFMRWDPPHGWLLGSIAQRFTASQTPRLASKYNYRIKWYDGWENHNLLLDNYEGNAHAPYGSWVLLEKCELAVDSD